MTRVLIVDDSPVGVEILTYILGRDPDITVLGAVGDGQQAVEAVPRLHPDIITMDAHLPRLNGFDATRRIMETHPTPIVMISGTMDTHDAAVAFRAMEAGALAILPRPALNQPTSRADAAHLVQTIKLMAEVKLVRRWQQKGPALPIASAITPKAADSADLRLVTIGVSTGGPLALKALLSQLPGDFPLPIAIVQHIALGFVDGFATWLGGDAGFPVHVASDRQVLQPGHAYIAPDGIHMGVDHRPMAVFSHSQPENGLRPAVSYLFRSAAQALGASAIGVLLTGMGKDGAQELKLMHDKGSVTFVQDQSSCVVFGMPEEAIRLGAAVHVLPPKEIGEALAKLAIARRPCQ